MSVQEAKLLLLEQRPEEAATWLPSLQKWVDAQMSGTNARYTRKGLWYVDRSGALRNAAMAANVAMRVAAIVDRVKVEPTDAKQLVWAHYARCFARQQMAYITGSAGRSFVTGWGRNPPRRPHHRNAACAFVRKGEKCTWATFKQPSRVFPNVLPGGLVGGPNGNDEFADNHLNNFSSEVSNDYNAALVSGASPLWLHVVETGKRMIERLTNAAARTYSAVSG